MSDRRPPALPLPPSAAVDAAPGTTRSWVHGLPVRSGDFPSATPLNRFFAWNEARRWRDRRYIIACDLYALITALGNDAIARNAAVAHLSSQPLILARRRDRLLLETKALPTVSRPANPELAVARAASPWLAFRSSGALKWSSGRLSSYRRKPASAAARSSDLCRASEVSGNATARRVVESLIASIGSANVDDHAAVFAAFELLANEIDLDALARSRPELVPSRPRSSPRRILVIRLSALGDLVQALGPAAAIRQYHRDDHITLLTTRALGEFARRLDFFDQVLIDRRPGLLDIGGWLALRRLLRRAGFDRVYDLQTSQRSGVYARLFRPRRMPEWSGIAAGCSHPHANLDRDRQHTIDKQTEQLLMAGMHPIPAPMLPPLTCALPQALAGGRFVLLVPGSSPRHPAKRWPARRFGLVAAALHRAGWIAVIIGSKTERGLAAAVREVCPSAIDLVGDTSLEEVAALAQRAALAIGNDTGVLHLAAAAGCPVIVLFSAVTDPALCAPRGRLVRILAAGDLGELVVDGVLAEALQILAPGTTQPDLPSRETNCEAVAGGDPG